jgi:hypothetical protein
MISSIIGATTPNQQITSEELTKIRRLDDFDVIMLVSDIHDHGWPIARLTLKLIPEGQTRSKK